MRLSSAYRNKAALARLIGNQLLHTVFFFPSALTLNWAYLFVGGFAPEVILQQLGITKFQGSVVSSGVCGYF